MADALPRGGDQLNHAVACATLVPCPVVPAGGCSALARIVCHHCCRNLLTSCHRAAKGLVILPLPAFRAPLLRIIVTILTMLRGYNHRRKK